MVGVDIELLTPDRLVRYLHRVPKEGAPLRLGEMLQEIAEADRPELEVPTFQDEESGLAVLALGSDPMTVTLEVQVVIELDSDVREVDGIACDVLRADLITPLTRSARGRNEPPRKPLGSARGIAHDRCGPPPPLGVIVSRARVRDDQCRAIAIHHCRGINCVRSRSACHDQWKGQP